MNIKTRITYQWRLCVWQTHREIGSGEFHHTLDLDNHNNNEKGKRTAKKQALQRFGKSICNKKGNR